MKTEKETLLEELIESAKSQEDKLATARVIANKDSQKTANAIKSLMSKKCLIRLKKRLDEKKNIWIISEKNS